MTLDDDLTDRTLAGRYTILRPAFQESLARVWVARDSRTDKLVHVKVLSPLLAADPVRFARFGREITASFLVTHQNTVEVLEFGEEEGLRWLALEYLAFRPLARELEKGRLPIERVASIAAQVAQAIGAAHQEGIVHRSLSPDNVLLLDNANGDFVKVRDFGFSKLDQGDEEQELTARDVRLGEATGMAPEYIESGAFDGKGDLYALGVLTFEMVAGRPPFQGSRESVLEQHVGTAAPRLRSIVPDAPPWLEALVADLLDKRPANRPAPYKVVQRLEDGVGQTLSPPELLPLDRDGAVVRRAAEPTASSAGGVVIGVAALLLVGGVGAAAVLVGAVAILALVLSLPA